MIQQLFIRLFKALRRLFYNTPVRHWRVTAVVSAWLARKVAAKAGSEPVIEVNFQGMRLLVPTKDTMLTPSLMAGTYEAGMIGAFRDELRRLTAASAASGRALRFADVGANIGLYSVLAAQQAAGAVRVDAFEPDPETASFLTRNLKLNGSAGDTVHQLAVGRTPGVATFDNASPQLACHHLAESGAKGIQVTVTTLDIVFAEDPSSVKLIKIDVEGFEPDVLAGAATVIRMASPTIFMEFHPHTLGRKDYAPADFLESLLNTFPSVAAVDEVTGKITPIPRAREQWPRDILAVGANLILRF